MRDWFTFEKNTGYAISVVIHAVVLCILSVWIFAEEPPRIVINSTFSNDAADEELSELLDTTLTLSEEVDESQERPVPVFAPESIPTLRTALMRENLATSSLDRALDDLGSGGSARGSWGQLLHNLQEDGLDIVLTFDSTGSMSGEIATLKRRLSRISRTLQELVPGVRIGVCTYRDQGDDYLVKSLPLTTSRDEITAFLRSIGADGGGDTPEAVLAGLNAASRENRFRPAAHKVILLFGDAPPHHGDVRECVAAAARFREDRGAVVSTVTCRREIREFELIAAAGGGESFESRNERELIEHLMILVFGSEHRKHVRRAFGLMGAGDSAYD